MNREQQNKIGKIRGAAVVLFLGFAVCCFFYPGTVSETFVTGAQVKPKPRATPRRQTKPAPRPPQRSRYSEFSHSVKQHQMACNSCHRFPTANWKQVRKGDAAFPDVTDYPRHESCINCHRQQFFRGANPPICTICHTNPSPRNAARHAFPNPREIFDQTARGQRSFSEFDIYFPHDKHIDIIAENKNPLDENLRRAGAGVSFVKARIKRSNEESCAVCHQTYQPQGDSDDEYATKPPAKLGDDFWLKKGTFKTSPISHSQCFTCHSTESGILPAPTDCATCHRTKRSITADFDPKLAAAMGIRDKIILSAWRDRISSGTFRHEFSSHADMSCSSCHNVTAMNTIDPKTKKVAVTSCAPCHITETSDDGGILNFEIDSRKTNPAFQCAKCHINFGKSPIPESHTKAISALLGN
jgi:hypothetical protein